MKAKMTTLSQNCSLFAQISAARSNSDVVLGKKCQVADKERDELGPLLAESEDSTGISSAASHGIRDYGSAFESGKFMLEKATAR